MMQSATNGANDRRIFHPLLPGAPSRPVSPAWPQTGPKKEGLNQDIGDSHDGNIEDPQKTNLAPISHSEAMDIYSGNGHRPFSFVGAPTT
jgi:hypothetical protein